MVKSAPSLTFNPTSIAFGTIDVGTSCAYKSYHVRNKMGGGSYADAVNMSISFLGSANSSEIKTESWVEVSTAKEDTRITSIPGTKECKAPSVTTSAANSINVRAKIIVPSGASTSGTVRFKLHHRYQYTG